MRILQLTARNVKRLVAVEIRPTGDLVVISGANGQGKSSVLDAIALALGGKNAVKGLTRPIRDGQPDAQVTVQLGAYTVTRSWVDDGDGNAASKLVVRDETGRSVTSPQKVLDAIVGDLSIDPLAFAEADAKVQRSMLLSVSDVDTAALDALEGRRAVAFEKRTDVTRRIRALDGQYDALPAVPDGTPTEETSASQALDRLQVAEASQRTMSMDAQLVERRKAETADARAVVEQLTLRLRDAQTAVAEAEIEELRATDKLEAYDGERVETDIVKARAAVQGLDAHNALVRQGIAKTRAAADVRAAREEHTALTAEIDAAVQGKADLLAALAMPVDGLGLDDDGAVTFQGIPLSQASSAERLRVSVAVAIAANPQVRVIHVKDGSLLDRQSLALLAEMAAEHDVQVWVERVEDNDPTAVVIEDGSVRGAAE